LKEEQKKEIE